MALCAGAAAIAAAALMLVPAPAAHAATYRSLVTEGPLEQLTISDELNCQVLHSADAQAQMYPSVDYEHGACGTQVAYGGSVYGPSDVPGGNDATDFVPVSQSEVSGLGTAASPYKIVTTVMAGTLQLTQTDTYVEGNEDYRTDVLVRNTSTTAPVTFTVYRFGDCFLHEDDQGYGRIAGPSAVACATHPTDPKAGTLTMTALTSGGRFYEGSYEALYDAISAGTALPSTCECDTLHENAAGLSWTVTLNKNGSKAFSSTMRISPTGPDAITMSKSVAPPEVVTGTQVQYTVFFKNPTAAPVTVTGVTDLMPPTFTYVPGSSSGLTTDEPAIDEATGRLSWPVAATVQPGASVFQRFKAIANGVKNGVYYNRAGGTGSIRVNPTGPEAQVRICTIVDTPGGHTINGTGANDVICARDGNDVVNGLGGSDVIYGGTGNDTISGGPGSDQLDGGTENDVVNGDGEGDRLFGYTGDDDLYGGDGNDRLDGGTDADMLRGGPGADLFFGGGGIDTVFYGESVLSQLIIDLNNTNGANDGESGERDDIRNDVENAVGGAAADTIIGNGLANLLEGGAGGDQIFGRARTDSLRGGAGYDTLVGNDDSTTADSLDCEADGGLAQPGSNDSVTGCDQ